MALQLRHRVVIIRFQRQIAALGIALEEPSFLQESGHTVSVLVVPKASELKASVVISIWGFRVSSS